MEEQKKLRLALVGALVVILVLVGALVWALTDDDAVKGLFAFEGVGVVGGVGRVVAG